MPRNRATFPFRWCVLFWLAIPAGLLQVAGCGGGAPEAKAPFGPPTPTTTSLYKATKSDGTTASFWQGKVSTMEFHGASRTRLPKPGRRYRRPCRT